MSLSGVDRPRLRRIAAFWPYALIAFLYLATSPFHAGLNNPNEMVRVYMTRALVEHQTFAIDPVIREWGYVDDKAVRDGRLYSSKAPLQSLLGVPVYPVVRSVLEALGLPADARHVTHGLRVLGSSIWGIAFAWLLTSWSRRRSVELGASADLGTAVGLTLALGTMLHPYALLYTGHLLAAVFAGGAYLAAVGLARTIPGTPRFRWLGILAGIAAAASPFAEYPSSLVAGPALVGALWLTRGWLWRAQLAGWIALGGLPVFGLGLWAHDRMWGHPFATGYGFLENRAYEALHSHGFFGVQLPRLDAFVGGLFSPATGLFFYSPVLLLGLAAIFGRIGARTDVEAPSMRSHRILAWTALVGFALEVLFLSSHRGWRGGWTLGPRYIIPVAPLLGLWVVEALASPRLRPWVAVLGALSIVLTGFAAALYPHLSDVYENPLATFVWPSYLRGETTYGIGHALGLEGTAANLVHVLPLVGAIIFVGTAGLTRRSGATPWESPRWRRAGLLVAVAVAAVAILWVVPEDDPLAARKENQRLWSFWEPARTEQRARSRGGPGLVGSALRSWRKARVVRVDAEGNSVECRPVGQRCRYGDRPWQAFHPETFEVAGSRERLLFFHPVGGERVRVEIPTPAEARRAVLHHGLSDASLESTNPHLVDVTVRQGSRELGRFDAGDRFGLETAELTLTSTAPISIGLAVEDDGSRVFGFDVEFFAR